MDEAACANPQVVTIWVVHMRCFRRRRTLSVRKVMMRILGKCRRKPLCHSHDLTELRSVDDL